MTKQRQNKETIKEVSLLETLINSMEDFIFCKDKEGRYLLCNDAFAKLFVGKSKEKVVGKTDKELFEKIDHTKLNFILEKDKNVIGGGKAIKVEWKTKLSDGRNVTLETIKTPFLDDKGKVAGLVGVSRDISESKKMEYELNNKVHSSEILNKVMVDRELKMVELKKEIADLKKSKENGKT